MKCPKCNNELPRDSKFCQYCGIKINRQHSASSKSINMFLAIGFIVSIISSIVLGYNLVSVQDEYSKGFKEGADAVIAAPVKYGLISRNDLVEHSNRYIECFQSYVTNNPRKFGLYSKSDMDDAYELGLDDMMYAILDNPEDYGLRY